MENRNFKTTKSKIPVSVLQFLQKNIPANGYLKFAKASSCFKEPSKPFTMFSQLAYLPNGLVGGDLVNGCLSLGKRLPTYIGVTYSISFEHPNMKELIKNIAIFKPKSLYFCYHNVEADMLRKLDLSSIERVSFKDAVVMEKNGDVLSMIELGKLFYNAKHCNIRYNGHR